MVFETTEGEGPHGRTLSSMLSEKGLHEDYPHSSYLQDRPSEPRPLPPNGEARQFGKRGERGSVFGSEKLRLVEFCLIK
jgi:hypothetical protein